VVRAAQALIGGEQLQRVRRRYFQQAKYESDADRPRQRLHDQGPGAQPIRHRRHRHNAEGANVSGKMIRNVAAFTASGGS
jgi:hypothetical protein